MTFKPKKAKRFKPNHSRSKPKKSYNSKQESTAKMGYGGDWQKYRFRFLARNPWCYVCGQKATVVDHVIVHKGSKDLFESLTNHMPLCKKDHDFITGKFDRGDTQDLEGKLEWIKSQRENSGISIKIKPLSYYRKGRGRLIKN